MEWIRGSDPRRGAGHHRVLAGLQRRPPGPHAGGLRRLSGNPTSGEANLFFEVMLHVGNPGGHPPALPGAVVAGARGFLLGAKDVPPGVPPPRRVARGATGIAATSPLIH